MPFHFYTISTAELNQVLELPGAHSEGVACYVRFHSPLYQLHSKTGHHFYTTSPFAAGQVPGVEAAAGPQNPDQWTFDGVACEVLLSADPPNELPTEIVIQMLNPGIGDYLYLADPNNQVGIAEQQAAQAAGYGYSTIAFTVPTGNALQVVQFNRFLNPTNNDHYYSISAQAPPDYHPEGVAFSVFQPSPFVTPLYRLRSEVNDDHLYSCDTSEFFAQGYVFESIACQVFSQPQPGTTPLFRLHSPANGDHLLTTSDAERITAVADGYVSDGISCEVYPAPGLYTTPLYRIRLG